MAAFFVGVASSFNQPIKLRKKETKVESANDFIATSFFFVIFGTLLPWNEWYRVPWWRWVSYVAILIFLRRLPLLFASYKLIPNIRTFGEAAFVGWNGPIAVAAMFYVFLLREEYGIVNELIFEAVAMAVFSSIVIFGVTSVPILKLLKQFMKKEQKAHSDSSMSSSSSSTPDDE